MDHKNLQGKVAVVTGGGSGIGLGIAKAWASRGADIFLLDIHGERLNEAQQLLEKNYNTRVGTQVTDARIKEELEVARDKVIEKFGRVDYLFNNAGIGGGGPVLESDVDEAWNRVWAINTKAVAYGLQVFVPVMRETDGGHIVNTASMAGIVAPIGLGIYNCTKHACVVLTETLRAELEQAGITDIGLSVLCPGLVNTPIANNSLEFLQNLQPDLNDTINNAANADSAQSTADVLAMGMNPELVGERVYEAVAAGNFYIFTDATFADQVKQRFDELESCFEATRNSQVFNAASKDQIGVTIGELSDNNQDIVDISGS